MMASGPCSAAPAARSTYSTASVAMIQSPLPICSDRAKGRRKYEMKNAAAPATARPSTPSVVSQKTGFPCELSLRQSKNSAAQAMDVRTVRRMNPVIGARREFEQRKIARSLLARDAKTDRAPKRRVVAEDDSVEPGVAHHRFDLRTGEALLQTRAEAVE